MNTRATLKKLKKEFEVWEKSKVKQLTPEEICQQQGWTFAEYTDALKADLDREALLEQSWKEYKGAIRQVEKDSGLKRFKETGEQNEQ